MYLSIHSNYDVNLLLKQATLARSTSNKNPFHWEQPFVTLWDLPWTPWRAVPGGPGGTPALRTENLKVLGHGGRVGPCLPRLRHLVSKQQRSRRGFLFLRRVFFFVDMFFGVFQWKNKLEFKHVFVVFRLKTWSCSFQWICVTSIKILRNIGVTAISDGILKPNRMGF